MLDSFDILKQFIPLHKRIEMKDHIVDVLSKAVPDDRWRKLIQNYRSDAAFREALDRALVRAVRKFVINYQDKELVEAVTHSARFWDTPSVQNALQEIITRPLSYLEPEQIVLFHSFADVLPTFEPDRVQQAVRFFLRCLTEEVITIPQLAPIYQTQFQLALVGLQHDHNQLITTLVETIAQNPMLPAVSADQPPLAKGPRVNHNLPSQYGVFLGRDQDIARVLEGLAGRWPLISIAGMGGMGKTALAIEIAHHCLLGSKVVLNPPFEYVVWVSAKDRPEQELWLNEVLDTTARLLGDFSITKLPIEQLEQKKREVDQLLCNNYTLLVIDNFETIIDLALESWLERVPYPSKVLITSRSNQLSHAWDIDLKGLDETTALALIYNHAQRFGLNSVKDASKEVLLPLVDVTGGNPRAIELALGHVKHGLGGLDEVVGYLHAARKSVNNVFDELFTRSWQTMTDNSKRILMVATFFADSMTKEALGAASGLSEYDLDKAVEDLVKFMLLDIKEGEAASSHRYSIHPLTRAFATMQLQDMPDFAEQARKRWSNYYLDFAARYLERDQSIEHYLNVLKRRGLAPVDLEWPNLSNVLVWADQAAQGQTFIGLMMLLTHYMDRRLFHLERLDNTRKAAETAHNLGIDEHAALFYIDGLGWGLIQQDRLADAEREILIGLRLAQSINPENPYATDLIALANTFLARIQIERGNIAEASTLIDKSIAIARSSTCRVRVNRVAGDIARKKGNYAEAVKFYGKVRHNLLQEGKLGEIEAKEVVNNLLGLTYLDSGNIEKAEISFNNMLFDEEQDNTSIGVVNTKYGLARVAQARGERDKARQLAQEAWDIFSCQLTSHRLLNQIRDFLQSLETN